MSDTPNITRGVQTDYKRMFKSDPNIALARPITLQAGYGKIDLGTAMAINGSAAGNIGKAIPYDPTAVTGAENAPGRAYLVQNSGTSDAFAYVTMDDSYKFAVGDDVYIIDDTTSVEQVGAIAEIDRATYTHMVKITFTTNIGGVAFTTARFAYLAVQGSDTCVGILQQTRNTGCGSTASGAQGAIVKANAQLYNGMLTNVDSAARTDISATVDGQYLQI